MHKTLPHPFTNKILIAGLVPFGMALSYDVLILYGPRIGNYGGGDALLLLALSFVTYFLACVLLIPCIVYLLYCRFRKGARLGRGQWSLVIASMIALLVPPAWLILLSHLR